VAAPIDQADDREHEDEQGSAEGEGQTGFRAQLHSTTGSAAGPYGYTISLGASGALTTGQLGSPGLLEALALMLGAVLAFVVLEVSAARSLVPEPPPEDSPPSLWGNAHIISAGGAICVVWGIVHAVGGIGGWFLVGIAATGVYFVLTAAQRIVIAHARRDRDPPSP
jgi:hypothetical protein